MTFMTSIQLKLIVHGERLENWFLGTGALSTIGMLQGLGFRFISTVRSSVNYNDPFVLLPSSVV